MAESSNKTSTGVSASPIFQRLACHARQLQTVSNFKEHATNTLYCQQFGTHDPQNPNSRFGPTSTEAVGETEEQRAVSLT